jgi:hypothetical protein
MSSAATPSPAAERNGSGDEDAAEQLRAELEHEQEIGRCLGERLRGELAESEIEVVALRMQVRTLALALAAVVGLRLWRRLRG